MTGVLRRSLSKVRLQSTFCGTQYTVFYLHSLIPKCHTVSRYTHRCIFIYVRKKSADFPVLIFAKFVFSPGMFVYVSCAKFYPGHSKNGKHSAPNMVAGILWIHSALDFSRMQFQTICYPCLCCHFVLHSVEETRTQSLLNWGCNKLSWENYLHGKAHV